MRGLAEIVHLRTGECRDAIDAIAQIAAGEEVEGVSASHVAECLRCQAVEVAAYRRILRTLRAMRGDAVVPPSGSLAGVLAALEVAADGPPGGSTPWATRVIYVGGITMATAAGAAGVLVWMSRRRRSRPRRLSLTAGYGQAWRFGDCRYYLEPPITSSSLC